MLLRGQDCLVGCVFCFCFFRDTSVDGKLFEGGAFSSSFSPRAQLAARREWQGNQRELMENK